MGFTKDNEFYTTSDNITIAFQRNWSSLESYQLPVLLFNYGLVCNNQHWKHQIPYFESLGFPIVLHDYRGHFLSEGQDNIDNITFEKISSDIDELLEHLKVDSIIPIGHSMGVNISLDYTIRYPKKVVGNIFISGTIMPPQEVMFDSSIINFIEPYVTWITNAFPTPYKKILQNSHKSQVARKIIHDGGFNTKRVPDDFVRTYMKKIGELPQDIFLHLMREMRKHQIYNHLSNIDTPSLVMGGDKDKVIPSYLQSVLHNSLPESELYVIKDGSHVPQVDFPNTVNERIKFFLQQRLELNV